MANDDPNDREGVDKVDAVHICDIDIAIPGGPDPLALSVYFDPASGYCFGIDKMYLYRMSDRTSDEIISPFNFTDVLNLT